MEYDVLNMDALRVPKVPLANALHMEAVNDVLNLIAKQVPLAKPTNVLHMVVANDVPIV